MWEQRTVKRAVEALYWLHHNEHHIVMTEWPKSMPLHKQTMENKSHISFANYHERIRVPTALCAEVFKHICPNKRKFDTRMYALTRKGREMVS